MRSNWLILACIVLILFGVSAYAWSVYHVTQDERLAASEASAALAGGEGEVSYTDLEGRSVDVSDRLGAILVVTTWASWCPSCATELPKLSSVAAEYPEVRFLAINRAEQRTTAERFLRSVNATSGIELILDPEDHYYESISGYAMPESVIYDKNGDIIHRFRGDIDLQVLRQMLDEAVETPVQ